ncbi:serine aminopeptidase domain-containing protein [Paraburkholderia strydomiana]
MRPVAFNGCSGWLHGPAALQPEMGVVLCNPFGYEALSVYRGWRELADLLAARGAVALRFDYPGTGDSGGNEEDPLRWRAWIDSIKAAVEFLRAETGVERVTLCGLRVGATLAALAAQELGGVDNLVLLMPVISGKAYIRELELQQHTWLAAQTALGLHLDEELPHTVGAHGFRLYPDTLELLAKVDLERAAECGAPCGSAAGTGLAARRVLLQDLAGSPRLKRLAARYEALGAQADVQFFGEYSKFLTDPSYSEPPRRAFDSVLQWLGAGTAPAPLPKVEVLDAAASASIAFAHGRETPVVFGGYVGVLCEPQRALDAAPAVLFVNTGGVHRIGDSRFTVLMARRLAAQGIASLRMDLSGLGDSLRRDATLTLRRTLFDLLDRRCLRGRRLVDSRWLPKGRHGRRLQWCLCEPAYRARAFRRGRLRVHQSAVFQVGRRSRAAGCAVRRAERGVSAGDAQSAQMAALAERSGQYSRDHRRARAQMVGARRRTRGCGA